jgi:dTDP-glucose pyrophosphorylase
MNNYKPLCVNENAPILQAIQQISENSGPLTLLVSDKKNRMVGTLTDGDIRRGLINGLTLSDKVSSFMNTKFLCVQEGFTVIDFKKARELGVRLLPILDRNRKIIKVYNLKNKKSALPIECMIMAGGRGERLRPLTDHTPKPMLLLEDKPIIEHNIDRLISYGIEKFYISVKYLGKQIVDYLGDGSSKNVSIEYVWENEPLGTAGALTLVNFFNTDYILLINSDIFTDANFEDLYLNVISECAEMGAASIKHSVKVPYGIFNEKNYRVTGLKEKPILNNYANAGIYILKSALVNEIPKNTYYNITDLMELLIKTDRKLIHNPITGYWIDIGQQQEYLNAKELIKHIRNGN